jgi:hypothetical protein
MRHLAIALLLACMLSGTTRAGEVPSTGVVAPQPSGSVVTTGEIHTTDALAGEIPTTDGDSTTVLTIILTLISIVR